MNFYVYIIYSISSDRYYVGYCADIETRHYKHNCGSTPSTKPYRPWKLVCSEEYTSRTDALKREKQIKMMKNKTVIPCKRPTVIL